MKYRIIFSLVAVLGFYTAGSAYESLQDAYNMAGRSPNGQYDKYLVLNPEIEYMGNLFITNADSVKIVGNGAIIHGGYGISSVYVIQTFIDISGCVLVDGAYGFYLANSTRGRLYNNTIFNHNEAGIYYANYYQMDSLYIWNNVIQRCSYGFMCIEDFRPFYIGFNTIWNGEGYRYVEKCVD